MPRYDYVCEACGPFTQWMGMSEVTSCTACPDCGEISNRLYSSIGVMLTSQALRQRIERGVEPKIVKKQSHSHDASCQHHGHSHGRRSHAHAHSRAPKRPWMVGH